MTKNVTAGMFGRINENGNVDVLHVTDGSRVTRIDADVWPLDNKFGTRYEHPEGIIISRADAKLIGLYVEREGGI